MKKYFAILLIISCLLQPTFALTFNDLDEASWAKDYILKLAKEDIVNGYADGSYKPLDSVSYYAAILVLYRTLDAQGLIDDAAVDIYTNRYRTALREAAVPDWPDLDRAVAYAIEKAIVSPAELKTFRTEEIDNPIPRQKMALYMARAWNLFWGESLDQPLTSAFKDVKQIDPAVLNDIDLLYRHQIISGDAEGNFNPTAALNRAELAKLIVTGIDAFKATDQVASQQIDAYVYVKLDPTQKIIFYQSDSKTKSYIEKIDESVAVIIDGVRAGYQDLLPEQQVVLSYANDKLIGVRVGALYQDVDGSLVSGRLTERLEHNGMRYVYIALPADETVVSYRLADDAIIVNGAQDVAFSDLPIDATLQLTVDGDVVKMIKLK